MPYEESLRKNRRRFNPERPDSILEHGLPDQKLERLYKEVDWERFKGSDPAFLHFGGRRIPYAVFDNMPEKTDKPEVLGPHLEERSEPPLGPPPRGEKVSLLSRNPLGHSRAFRRRRFLNWFPLGLTYATMYMGRYNFNVVKNDIGAWYHLDKAQMGLIATVGFWTYGLSVMPQRPAGRPHRRAQGDPDRRAGGGGAEPGHRPDVLQRLDRPTSSGT